MKSTIKTLTAIAVLVVIISSCYKEPVDYSKDINDLKALVTELQHRSDSLATALGNTNTNLSNLSKSVDSIKLKLTDIQTQIDALTLSLTTANANIAAINAQLILLNQQYASLLAQLNAILAILNAAPTTLSDGLIAYYPFSGNAGDSSGNGNHGSSNGAILTTDRFGVNNGAYLFDGTNEIIVPHSNNLNLTADMSISAWFNSYGPPTFRTNHMIVSKRSNDQFNTFPYGLCINYQYGFPTEYKKPMFASAISYPNGYQFLQSTNDITNNLWNHIVATVSINTLKIYINGSVVLNTTIDNSLRIANTSNLLIGSGARLDKPAEQFVGKLDEVRIYNRALNQSEINYLATH